MKKIVITVLLSFCIMLICHLSLIYGYKVVEIEKDSVVLSFSVDSESTVQLRYGDDINNLTEIYVGIKKTNKHTVRLSGLESGKLYYFLAEFFDLSRKITAEKGYFITAGTPKPAIESVKVKNKDWKSSVVEIISSVPMDFRVECISSKMIGSKEAAANRNLISSPLNVNKKIKVEKDRGAKIQMFKSEYLIKGLKPREEYVVKISGSEKVTKIIKVTQVTFISGEHNIALKKRVYGTFDSTYIADKYKLKGDILSRVTDGSFNYFTGMAVSHPIEEGSQWVVVDLKKNYSISKVITYWRALCYPEYYRLEYKTYKKGAGTMTTKKNILKEKWDVINERVDVEKLPAVRIGGMPVKVIETDCNNINARYIRLFIGKGWPYYRKFDSYTFVQLLEMKVYPQAEGTR